jgi:hypothetical protein
MVSDVAYALQSTRHFLLFSRHVTSITRAHPGKKKTLFLVQNKKGITLTVCTPFPLCRHLTGIGSYKTKH